MEPIKGFVDDVHEGVFGYRIEVLLPTTQILQATTNTPFQIGDEVWVTIDFEHGVINKVMASEELIEEVIEPNAENICEVFEIVEHENDPIDD